MPQRWLFTGLLVLVLALAAACDVGGDDDDDNGGLDTENGTEVVEEATEAEDEADATAADETATSADDMATEAEDDEMTTETEAEVDSTEAEDGTPTEAEDGTPTEDADVTGTEGEAGGTATESEATEADGTETEVDGTATEMEGTETDGDEGTAETGEPIELGDIVLTVQEAVVLDSTTIGEFGGILGLEEGNQFIGVQMDIENAGSEPIAVTDVLGRVHLEDGDGEEYGVDLGATALALLSGEFENVSQIDGGDEVAVMLGFQVPEDVQLDDLTLVIEPEDESGEPTRVPLGGGSS